MEAAFLLTAMVAVALVFGFFGLDIGVARAFYSADGPDHWPLAKELPWRVLYDSAPWFTAGLVVAGLVALAASVRRPWRSWRRSAVLVLLAVAIGPGLLVNTVFKDHWSHPRPREIVDFGGSMQFVRTPLPGSEGGASFPCGHCGVGFMYGAGWWIWRRRRPRWAAASLGVGITLGVALGIGRMAAGGHFLSDIIWSALFAFGVLHLLYYHVLRLADTARPDIAPARWRRGSALWQRALTYVAATGALGTLLALFATPHGTSLTGSVVLAALPTPPAVLRVDAERADIQITLIDAPASALSVHGELHGFGLPTSRLETNVDFLPQPVPTLRYRIEQRGWFTDLDGTAMLEMPAESLRAVVVRVHRGNITVLDATRRHVVDSHAVQLDLRTDYGHVASADAR